MEGSAKTSVPTMLPAKETRTIWLSALTMPRMTVVLVREPGWSAIPELPSRLKNVIGI